MAECRLAPAAENDLETIWSYTALKWSVEQANRYTDIRQWPLMNWHSRRDWLRHVTTFGQVIVAKVLSGT